MGCAGEDSHDIEMLVLPSAVQPAPGRGRQAGKEDEAMKVFYTYDDQDGDVHVVSFELKPADALPGV